MNKFGYTHKSLLKTNKIIIMKEKKGSKSSYSTKILKNIYQNE